MLNKIRSKINENIHFRDVLKGSGIAFLSKIFSTAIGLITSIYIARHYGANIIGVMAIINSVLVIFSIFGLMGNNVAIIRIIPEYIEKYSLGSAYVAYKYALGNIFLLSIIASIVLFFLSDIMSVHMFKIEHMNYFIIMASFFVIVRAFNIFNQDVLRALQKIKIYSQVQILTSLITLLFILWATHLFYNEYNPIYVMFGSNLFVFITVCFLVKYEFSCVKKIKNEPSISRSQLISISFPMFITASIHMVISQTDIIMLGVMKSESEVGIYNIVVKLSLLTSFILNAVNAIVAPKFSKLYHSGKIKDLRIVAQKSSKLIFWGTFPIIIIYIIAGQWVLSIYGNEFIIGYYALVFLTIGQFVNSAVGSVGYFLDMTGHQKIIRNIVVLGGIINILSNIVLIPKFGINGAAFSSMISIVIWNIIASIYIKYKFGFFITYIPFISRNNYEKVT